MIGDLQLVVVFAAGALTGCGAHAWIRPRRRPEPLVDVTRARRHRHALDRARGGHR